MIEICLASKIGKKEILHYIHDSIEDTMLASISVFHIDEQFVYLLIAVDSEKSVQLIKHIKKCIALYITDEYKYDYIFARLCNITHSHKLNEDYVRVLSMFDSDVESDLIVSLLPRGERIFVDSFIDFRLQPLHQRWDEICDIALKS